MHINVKVWVPDTEKPVVVVMEEQSQNSDYLEYSLELSKLACSDYNPFRGCNATETGYDYLSAQNDEHHPGRCAAKW